MIFCQWTTHAFNQNVKSPVKYFICSHQFIFITSFFQSLKKRTVKILESQLFLNVISLFNSCVVIQQHFSTFFVILFNICFWLSSTSFYKWDRVKFIRLRCANWRFWRFSNFPFLFIRPCCLRNLSNCRLVEHLGS